MLASSANSLPSTESSNCDYDAFRMPLRIRALKNPKPHSPTIGTRTANNSRIRFATWSTETRRRKMVSLRAELGSPVLTTVVFVSHPLLNGPWVCSTQYSAPTLTTQRTETTIPSLCQPLSRTRIEVLHCPYRDQTKIRLISLTLEISQSP